MVHKTAKTVSKMDHFHPDFLHKAEMKNQKKSEKNLEWVRKSEVFWFKSEVNQVWNHH